MIIGPEHIYLRHGTKPFDRGKAKTAYSSNHPNRTLEYLHQFGTLQRIYKSCQDISYNKRSRLHICLPNRSLECVSI